MQKKIIQIFFVLNFIASTLLSGMTTIGNKRQAEDAMNAQFKRLHVMPAQEQDDFLRELEADASERQQRLIDAQIAKQKIVEKRQRQLQAYQYACRHRENLVKSIADNLDNGLYLAFYQRDPRLFDALLQAVMLSVGNSFKFAVEQNGFNLLPEEKYSFSLMLNKTKGSVQAVVREEYLHGLSKTDAFMFTMIAVMKALWNDCMQQLGMVSSSNNSTTKKTSDEIASSVRNFAERLARLLSDKTFIIQETSSYDNFKIFELGNFLDSYCTKGPRSYIPDAYVDDEYVAPRVEILHKELIRQVLQYVRMHLGVIEKQSFKLQDLNISYDDLKLIFLSKINKELECVANCEYWVLDSQYKNDKKTINCALFCFKSLMLFGLSVALYYAVAGNFSLNRMVDLVGQNQTLVGLANAAMITSALCGIMLVGVLRIKAFKSKIKKQSTY